MLTTSTVMMHPPSPPPNCRRDLNPATFHARANCVCCLVSFFIQASEAQIIKDMQVEYRSMISLFHLHNFLLHVVAAVISAANELNRVGATCNKHHPDVNRQQLPPLLNFGQASQIDPSHPVPPMLLALHTRVLQDDRWLVRPSPTVFVYYPRLNLSQVVLPRKALLQMMVPFLLSP